MAETIIAHTAQETTPEEAGDLEHVSSIVARCIPESPPAYVLRGHGLFELYAEELEYLGSGKWLIPSGTEAGLVYEVRPGTRSPEHDWCECIGFRHHGHCSHIECAKLAHRKSAVCDGCGERRWWKHLEEVTEDDELLSWFPGDVLCEECIDCGVWA